MSQASTSALIVAGEASGDRYGAALAATLPRLAPVEWFGIGGDAMQAAGVALTEHAREIAVLGIVEVARHLPRIRRIFRRLLAEVDRRRPRFAVLIDSPDFNLRLARQLHRRRIPIVYFVAPQVWAWRPGRLKLLRRYVTKLLCIFPFEEEFFRGHGVNADFVGHPLVDAARPSLTRKEFFARHHLDPGRPTVCLLPGSRNQEVRRHLPQLLEAARLLCRQHPVQFTLVRASTVAPPLVEDLLRRASDVPLTLLDDTTYNALAGSDLAVISSGTATVEALLLETPMVVVYRVATPSWWVGKLLVRTPYYSMVNLLAERPLVPELIQSDFTPARVASEVARLLNDPAARRRIQQEMAEVKKKLGPPGAIERACRALAAAVGLAAETVPAR
ncbi:MAG: lipid-A-disaccharide synthase [Acidobacteria bacterium]|nr:lipid-A-disaccharide synthase [Acidobacteriota bacterium]